MTFSYEVAATDNRVAIIGFIHLAKGIARGKNLSTVVPDITCSSLSSGIRWLHNKLYTREQDNSKSMEGKVLPN